MRKPSTIPFRFILDELDALHPVVKPMFSCYGVYIGEKIMLMLRNRDSYTADNGVWISTRLQHHESLKKIFPSLRSIRVLGIGETNWQIIPEDAEDFEESALKVCSLIIRHDERIGNIPKSKKKKTKG